MQVKMIGQRLKALREGNKITQAKLAHANGTIAQSAINRYENGYSDVPNAILHLRQRCILSVLLFPSVHTVLLLHIVLSRFSLLYPKISDLSTVFENSMLANPKTETCRLPLKSVPPLA